MAASTTQLQSVGVRAVETVGRGAYQLVDDIGGIFSLGVDVARWTVKPPFRFTNFFQQLDFIGVGSIFIVVFTGTFSGMVFAHQSARAFEMFDAQSLIAP